MWVFKFAIILTCWTTTNCLKVSNPVDCQALLFPRDCLCNVTVTTHKRRTNEVLSVACINLNGTLGNITQSNSKPITNIYIVNSELTLPELHKLDFATIKHMDLAFNKINAIHDSDFNSAIKLEELILNYNPIQTITLAAFSNNYKLRILQLEGTPIKNYNFVHVLGFVTSHYTGTFKPATVLNLDGSNAVATAIDLDSFKLFTKVHVTPEACVCNKSLPITFDCTEQPSSFFQSLLKSAISENLPQREKVCTNSNFTSSLKDFKFEFYCGSSNCLKDNKQIVYDMSIYNMENMTLNLKSRNKREHKSVKFQPDTRFESKPTTKPTPIPLEFVSGTNKTTAFDDNTPFNTTTTPKEPTTEINSMESTRNETIPSVLLPKNTQYFMTNETLTNSDQQTKENLTNKENTTLPTILEGDEIMEYVPITTESATTTDNVTMITTLLNVAKKNDNISIPPVVANETTIDIETTPATTEDRTQTDWPIIQNNTYDIETKNNHKYFASTEVVETGTMSSELEFEEIIDNSTQCGEAIVPDCNSSNFCSNTSPEVKDENSEYVSTTPVGYITTDETNIQVETTPDASEIYIQTDRAVIRNNDNNVGTKIDHKYFAVTKIFESSTISSKLEVEQLMNNSTQTVLADCSSSNFNNNSAKYCNPHANWSQLNGSSAEKYEPQTQEEKENLKDIKNILNTQILNETLPINTSTTKNVTNLSVDGIVNGENVSLLSSQKINKETPEFDGITTFQSLPPNTTKPEELENKINDLLEEKNKIAYYDPPTNTFDHHNYQLVNTVTVWLTGGLLILCLILVILLAIYIIKQL